MEKTAKRYFSLICLVLTTLTFLFYQFCRTRYPLVLMHYTAPLVFAFLGMTLFSDGLRKQVDVWVGLLMMGWYVVSRLLLRELYLETSYSDFCMLIASMCMTLTFSMYADDRQHKGLQSASVLSAVVIGMTAWLSVFGIILGTQITLPGIGSIFGWGSVENRLYANLHPNLSAALFLVAIMLGVWYLLEHGRRWMILPAVVIFVGLYTGIASTLSRTVMIQLSSAVALAVFFQGLKLPTQKRWLRAGISAALAAAAFLIVYQGFDVFRRLVNYAAVSSALAETIVERPLLQDLTTLTGRTQIYRDIWNMLMDHPKIFFVGTLSPELDVLLQRYTGGYVHGHNAYLQILLVMGFPGVFAALWFSLRAVWAGWRILVRHRNRVTFAQKWLAICLQVMLLSVVTEPYLFAGFLPTYNFVFFLILGHLLVLECSLRTA